MISVLIPTYNEEENIQKLILKTKKVLATFKEKFEIIIADAGSKDRSIEIAKKNNVNVFIRKNPGFGSAILEGIPKARGDYVFTMDADFSHNPTYLKKMWKYKERADIIVASRWVKEGSTEQTTFRKLLSKFFNFFFKTVLSLNLHDMNSNFRLYRKVVLDGLELNGKDFDILPEILVKTKIKGYRILEIPFHYRSRKGGKSKLTLMKFSVVYLKRLLELWALRNSIHAADYDERAFFSKIPLQRYWQRKRFKVITNWVNDLDGIILDAGCGSSMIVQHLFASKRMVAFDINKNRIRYLHNKHEKKMMVVGDVLHLPFKKNIFQAIILSNVIEHMSDPAEIIINQVKCMLKKNGIFILATPDYDSFFWNFIENIYDWVKLGKSYKGEHVNKYSSKKIKYLFDRLGFKIAHHDTILTGEIIIKAKK